MQRVPVERGVGTAAQHQRALEYAVLQATLGQQLGAAAPVRAEPVQRHDAGQRFHGRGRRHGTLGLPGQALARRVERKGDEGQIGLGQPMRLHQLAHRGGDGRGVRRNACAGAQERDEKRGQQGRQAGATGSCRQGAQRWGGIAVHGRRMLTEITRSSPWNLPASRMRVWSGRMPRGYCADAVPRLLRGHHSGRAPTCRVPLHNRT